METDEFTALCVINMHWNTSGMFVVILGYPPKHRLTTPLW